MADKLLIKNCVLFDDKAKHPVAILIEDGIISQIEQNIPDNACDNTIDAKGAIITPGFIDVHIQGAGKADILDSSTEAIEKISQTCARFGTTSFLGTTIYNTASDNRHLAIAADCVNKDLGGAKMPGLHMESPFISPDKRGAIPADCIAGCSGKILDETLSITKGKLKMMVVAPELAGSLPIIRKLAACGIIPCLGHSAATYEQTMAGIEAGLCHVTHTFNAMPGIHHRNPGPLIAIFNNDSVTLQMICDGVHIHPSVIKFLYNAIGPERIVLITDGVCALGAGDGSYNHGDVKFESKNGICMCEDGTLAGAAVPLNQMLKRFMEFTGCGLDVAIKTVTENPAKVLGIDDKKGTIKPGKDADLVLLTDKLEVKTTIVEGKIIFNS